MQYKNANISCVYLVLLSDSFDFDLNCFLCENRTSSSSRLDEKPVRLWAFLHCVMWWLQPWDGSARCPITASLTHTLRIPHFTAAAAAVHSHLSQPLGATHLPCLSISPFFWSEERNMSCEWWRMYPSIAASFSSITLEAELCREPRYGLGESDQLLFLSSLKSSHSLNNTVRDGGLEF